MRRDRGIKHNTNGLSYTHRQTHTHTHKQAQSQTHIERQEFLAIAVDKFRSQGRGEGYLLKELLIGI